MGSKSKHFLKEDTVPTIFSFTPEPARKHQKSSISRAEKRGKKLCIEENISSHKACSSHVYKTYKSLNLLQNSALAWGH